LLEETSETETAYMSESAVEETPATEDIADSYEFSSAETLLFPSLLDGNDSGFTALMSMEATAENAAADAGLNAAQNAGANSTPVAATEVISQMIVSQTPAAPSPETADVNVQQAAASSSGEAANGGKELLAALTGEQKSADAEPVPPELNELLEKGVFQKNQVSAQNAGRNAAAPSRGDQVRYEIKPEAKATVNAEPELSKQPAIRTSSENDALIMERVAAQTARQRNGAALANASENAGKTVQVMETSFQLTSATTKAEASVPTRNVPMSDQEFVIELAGRIQAQIRGGREMIRIQLHPEELGRLEIRAESGRNGIIARIAAESLDVKKILEGNLQGLQQTLEARGLKVDRLHIVVEDSADAALFADGGRYGHAGTGPRNSEVSNDYPGSAGARTKSQNDNELNDLSMALEAEQRGVGFYTVG
jgi:flagellar hook-length control protein FliK